MEEQGKYIGVTVPGESALLHLLPLSNWLLSPVEEAAPISGPQSPTLAHRSPGCSCSLFDLAVQEL